MPPSGRGVGYDATLTGLKGLGDADIAAMSDERVKQTLMDLRALTTFQGLGRLSNEQIARLGSAEAKQKLIDARNVALRRS